MHQRESAEFGVSIDLLDRLMGSNLEVPRGLQVPTRLNQGQIRMCGASVDPRDLVIAAPVA